jgi:hypothetical protein
MTADRRLKVCALFAALGIPAAFAAGAWAQNERVREPYLREGAHAGYRDIESDAVMAYLKCLKEAPGCEQQRQTYDAVAAMVRARLSPPATTVQEDNR